mmetsp:Transcript_50761/g.120899  ORF Transcript_50761/g.120899 Transcript_50761/m.120899 type:complete len:219 (-) Transcript_50761:724-1380(-)
MSGTLPSVVMRPAKWIAAPLTCGTRSSIEGECARSPASLSPGFCPCWYMMSQSFALIWIEWSRRVCASASSTDAIRIASAWARNSQAIRIWKDVKRGSVWWHTMRPHSVSLATIASTSEDRTPMFTRYSAWHTCGRRSVDPPRLTAIPLGRSASPSGVTMGECTTWASTMMRTSSVLSWSRVRCGTSVAGKCNPIQEVGRESSLLSAITSPCMSSWNL